MIFQSLMGLGKSRCDIPSGPPKDVFAQLSLIINLAIWKVINGSILVFVPWVGPMITMWILPYGKVDGVGNIPKNPSTSEKYVKE
jgi:hypothetical protein